MSKWTVTLILIGITLIAAGLRLYGLANQSLWHDEVVEETAFKQQFISDKQLIHIFPPLHSFLIYLITVIYPGNDLALRLVPFTFGVISVPLLFLLGKRLFNENVGLIASFLLAVSPFHIWYSQEVRVYALQWMLALISLLYFLRALAKPSRGSYTGYVVSTVAGLYANQLTVFLISFQFLYLLFFLQKYKSQLLRWVSSFCAVVILYLPWIIYNFMTYEHRRSGFSKELDLKAILYTIYTYCVGFSVGPSLRELHFDRSMAVIAPHFLTIVSVLMLYGILFLIGVWALKNNYSNFLFLILLFTIPIIGIIALDIAMPNISYNVRYTGISLFGFLLFLAKGIDWLYHLKPKFLGILFMVAAILSTTGLSAYSYFNYQFERKYKKEDIRGAVSYIRDNISADDVLMCISDPLAFNRYSGNDFKCSTFHKEDQYDLAKVDVKMSKIVEGKKRLWLILSREWDEAILSPLVKEWLDENYIEIKDLRKNITEIANVRIFCYDLSGKATIKSD